MLFYNLDGPISHILSQIYFLEPSEKQKYTISKCHISSFLCFFLHPFCVSVLNKACLDLVDKSLQVDIPINVIVSEFCSVSEFI